MSISTLERLNTKKDMQQEDDRLSRKLKNPLLVQQLYNRLPEDKLNQLCPLKILSDFIEKTCENADRILVDPNPTNLKAIHVYNQCGFIKISEFESKNKKHQIMLATPQHRLFKRESNNV